MVKIAANYEYMLCEAWNVECPARCKITPARVEAAKAALRKRIETRAGMRAWGDTAVRAVVRRMVRKLHACGLTVARVKVPDGPRGSHYIVLTDGRHIRIADHFGPTNFKGEPEGGFSSRLNRRHRVACRSIVVRTIYNSEKLEILRDY